MKIHCIACQTPFHYPTDRISLNGSMVRCRMCSFIFLVFQNPDALGAPVAQDTNIDQAILNDLLEMQQKSGGRPWADEISDGRAGYGFDAAKPTHVVPEENPDDGINQNDCADLPDLSDLEKMIDWDDLDEHGDPSARWGRNRISSP